MIAPTRAHQIRVLRWMEYPLPQGYYTLYTQDAGVDSTFRCCRQWTILAGTKNLHQQLGVARDAEKSPLSILPGAGGASQRSFASGETSSQSSLPFRERYEALAPELVEGRLGEVTGEAARNPHRPALLRCD